MGVIADNPSTTDLKKEVFISLSSLRHLDPEFVQEDFSWTSSRHQLFIKLRENASAEELQGQLAAFSEKYFGALAKAYQFKLQALKEVHFDTRYGGAISWSLLAMLAIIAVFLLSIACINFINLVCSGRCLLPADSAANGEFSGYKSRCSQSGTFAQE